MMKKAWVLVALIAITVGCKAQGYYTQYYQDKNFVEQAKAWMDRGEWRNGFTKAGPHHSVNPADFYTQYRKNTQLWDALFDWLAKTDLMAIPKGKHPIEGTPLVASVEDSSNGPLEKRNSESHHHNIDFQYVVKGTERFGIIDHYTSKPNCRYKPDVIHYDYDVEKVRFYDSTPDKFFIFFPSDWHIAKVTTELDDQNIRVIVIKVPFAE